MFDAHKDYWGANYNAHIVRQIYLLVEATRPYMDQLSDLSRSNLLQREKKPIVKSIVNQAIEDSKQFDNCNAKTRDAVVNEVLKDIRR